MPTISTPIYDYLCQLADGDTTRFHMPGHKGRHPNALLQKISQYDITEIIGADSLYSPSGIILESEENTSKLYNSKFSCFSAGGSTLCIQTMLALFASSKAIVIAARNAHTAFINSCALLDITPFWVKPDYNDSFGVSGEITKSSIENAILAVPNAAAVYITSPDYLGCMSDINAIAQVCKKYNKPLIVDNAHGAHLKFTKTDCHPITLGAAICCDSAHKTLPVFTGGAYIHVSKDCNITSEQVKSKMSLFGSTSPSYLILMSLDLNNRYIYEHAKEDFSRLEDTLDELYKIAFLKGFLPISKHYDLTKLTLDAFKVGLSGEELSDYLRQNKIECEYASSRHVVLMLSPQNSQADIKKITDAIVALPIKAPIVSNETSFELPNAVMSVRQATFSNKILIDVDSSIGKIAGETKIKCPPGVPIIVAGEVIDANTQKLLKKSSISTINVIK